MTKLEEIIENQIKEVEEEIIEWAKLLARCKPDSTRFKTRIESLEREFQVRRGLFHLQLEEGFTTVRVEPM